jgi:hypothetical protein
VSEITPRTLTLYVKVLDYYNNEIKGAIVEIKDIYNVTVFNATTDAWGLATFTLPPGNYTLVVSYRNVTEVKHVYLSETQHIEFKLKTLAVVPVREIVLESHTLIFLAIAIIGVILAFYFERQKKLYIAVPVAGITVFSLFYSLAVGLKLVKPFIQVPVPKMNVSVPQISLPSNLSLLTNTYFVIAVSCVFVISASLFAIYRKTHSKPRKRIVKKRYRYARSVRI